VPDAASKLTPKKGQVTFVGTNIKVPMSVSAQQSSDGATVVVRVVNNAAASAQVDLVLDSADDASYGAAHAMQLQSDSPDDANPSWDVDYITPKAVPVTIVGGKATMTLPSYSYTVVTVTK
jgi:alpha-L-arabinofuranosidase